MTSHDIVLCRHEECKKKQLSFNEWNDLIDWFPIISGRGNLLSDLASKFLYDRSKAKNKPSAWYCVQNFKEFTDQKEIWFEHKFRGDFEIWREDHTVYQLSNGHYLVHK
jgi:hypothetical protein